MKSLSEDWVDDVAVYVGETEPPALMFKCQTLMVDSHQVHDGRLEVVDVDAIVDSIDR